MRPSEDDIDWMLDGFSNLTYDPEGRVIEGILSFSAAYNGVSGKLRIGCEDADTESASFLYDAFSIKIDLSETDDNGLPVVYETGGRFQEIAEREGVDAIDIHFYENGQCCLGIQYAPALRLTLEALIYDLIVPFLAIYKFHRDAARERVMRALDGKPAGKTGSRIADFAGFNSFGARIMESGRRGR